jgi:hydroxymethylpyrimidine/phosphomethylpyrimidine kinase
MPAKNIRPYVLSIAGFDPSGGAGVLADIKTFEAFKAIGLGVSTSITFQNESEFKGVNWLNFDQIKNQLEPLFKIYKIRYVKIGLVENFQVLEQVIDYLLSWDKKIRIIWDPILRASAGFPFHKEVSMQTLLKVLDKLFLITPNWEEMKALGNTSNPIEAATEFQQYCMVYLKGGHNSESQGKDYLFSKEKQYSFRPKKLSQFDKHGTGCVLSAALIANMARGYRMHKACLVAKSYITHYLESNQSLLGYHKI